MFLFSCSFGCILKKNETRNIGFKFLKKSLIGTVLVGSKYDDLSSVMSAETAPFTST